MEDNKRNYYLLISICLIIGFILAGCNGVVDQVSSDKPHDVTGSEEDKEEPEKEVSCCR